MKNTIKLLLLLTIALLMIVTPTFAHEGTAGEHLILGLDTGILLGIAIGLIAGFGSATVYFKNRVTPKND